jgi:glycosyltransferase involved in cell wall biosynthesis
VSAPSEAPHVSVVINVYNGVPYLAEAIESVLGQTYRNRELIVVDDGSDDGTEELAQRYGDELRYDRLPRSGIGAARNRGVDLASGEYFAFLDADDRFVPDKLERQMAAFAADPELEMAFGHMSEFFSPELDPAVAARIRPPVQDAPWRMTNLMVVKRDSFFRVGPFSTALKVGVGVDWYARASEAGLKEAIVPAVVLERRLHAANNGILQQAARPQYLRVLKAHIDRRRAAEGKADETPEETGR